MNFDINTVLSDMLSAIKVTVLNNRDKVGAAAKQFLQNDMDRLKMLAELRITGELTEEKFKSRLLDEKLMIEAELNALEVLSKALAQQAANAAFEVFEKAVQTAVRGVI